MAFAWLMGRRKEAEARRAVCRTLYENIVKQSREPAFYEGGKVPDTLNGRFDMIALHMMLALRAIKGQEAAPLAQDLLDTFLRDMDESLREMGISDFTISKRMRDLNSAFYGRIAAYEDALRAEDREAMAEALRRNMYRGEVPVSQPVLLAFADYIAREAASLIVQGYETLQTGEVRFGPPPVFPAESGADAPGAGA